MEDKGSGTPSLSRTRDQKNPTGLMAFLPSGFLPLLSEHVLDSSDGHWYLSNGSFAWV